MQKRIEINIFFLIFLCIAILTIFVDYITFFLDLNYLVELLIAIPIVLLLCYILRKKIKIKNNIEKEDLFFFIFLIIIMGLTIVFPDKSYDTINYHLYNQIYPFANKVNIDFFPNSFIQSFSYAYPDRIFYIFRYILGYRLGTILNYYLIVILYYQVKKILCNVFKIKGIVKNIFATGIILTLSILDVMDTYYIDLMSLTLLIELFDKALFGPLITEDRKNNTNIIVYFGLIAGLIFATKISNIFFIFILGIVYLIRNIKEIKNIKIIHYILFIILFLIPSILYIYNTWKQTGNPVYPFYNTIFKSEYYPISDWMDPRFGPKNIIEVIIWPILILKYPNRAYDIGMIEPIWTFGYIIAYIYVIYSIIMKIKKKDFNMQNFCFSIICILFNLVWAKFLLGYVRYGLFVLIINNIITSVFIYDIIRNKKIILITIMSIILLYNYGYCYKLYMYHGDFWSYNNYFAYNNELYKYNLQKLFTKNDIKVNFPEKSAWGTLNSNSGFMKLLNNEIPMIHLGNNNLLGSNNLEKIDLKRNELLSDIEHIYIVSDYLEFSDFIPYLNKEGYQIKNLFDIVKPDYLNGNNFIYIFEIEKVDNANNHYIEINNHSFSSLVGKKKISFYYGLSGSMNGIKVNDFKLQIMYNNELLKEEKLIKNDYSLKYFEHVFNKKVDKNDSLFIRVVDSNNNEIDYVKLLILNDTVE